MSQGKRGSFGSKGPDIEMILKDPVNLNYFKKFCMAEMSMENLLFWLEVQDFKQIEAPEYAGFVARKIFNKYIRVGAPQQLAVESGLRSTIQSTFKPNVIQSNIFNEIQNACVLSMKLDIFPRFVDSDLYKELAALKYEERKVVTINEFDLYRFLGAGGFGMVLLSKKKDTGKFYAIKVIDKRILISQNQTHSIFREKEVLACVEHPFIVALRYAFQTEDHLCFVLDFIEGGNMYSDLMRGPYTHERAVFYAAQIVLATQHLHELDVLYRDLKPDNVLLTLNGFVKLADMGAARGIADDGTIAGGEQATPSSDKTAKVSDPTKGRRMTITGTHGYRAPEVYERDYGKEADWWNVGILIIEMLSAENPLRGENRRESEYLTKHKDLQLPAYFKSEAKSIALDFLRRNPKERLGCRAAGIKEIKDHPFFMKDNLIDWEKLMGMELDPPFESDLEYEKPSRQAVTAGFSQLDFFCQMVDYMKTSMSMRTTWPLKPEDQKVFEDFDFVSNKVFEEELTDAMKADAKRGSPF
ncbi:hypothetical protein AB1Y20_007147 [Prymnesium parvum]|uniref:G protein-coupled receptor kinase n=1 Tax=Prymnesium parvum TaxID=97485 RepID=A0AB34IWA1_PRYPA